jgi:hypothetical protein
MASIGEERLTAVLHRHVRVASRGRDVAATGTAVTNTGPVSAPSF